jgi:hypothetical protein
MVPALATGLGVFVGIAIGFFVWARPLERARGKLALAMREIRAHVIPVLERRATSLDIPKDARGARDAEDAVQAAVTTARAIATSEEKLVLPFSDTVELSRSELAPATKKK